MLLYDDLVMTRAWIVAVISCSFGEVAVLVCCVVASMRVWVPAAMGPRSPVTEATPRGCVDNKTIMSLLCWDDTSLLYNVILMSYCNALYVFVDPRGQYERAQSGEGPGVDTKVLQ
jgi:hypothetical protein